MSLKYNISYYFINYILYTKTIFFTYCQHLEALISFRFENILKMDISEWVLDPFSNIEMIDSTRLKDELIQITTNKELKLKFKEDYQAFWLQDTYALSWIICCTNMFNSISIILLG